MNNNPIILALDHANIAESASLIDKVRDYIGVIKIGPTLWANHGIEALELGRNFNLPMFLDLKLNDVPSVVGKTIECLSMKNNSYYQIRFITVHALGGTEMLKAALSSASPMIKITAVTLLTSLNRDDLRDFGIKGVPGTFTVRAAKLAYDAGIRSFVCSPQHIELMHDNFSNITLVCPGIRSANAPPDDQKRTKPLSFALKAGVDYVVIGRAIANSSDPKNTARDIYEQALSIRP